MDTYTSGRIKPYWRGRLHAYGAGLWLVLMPWWIQRQPGPLPWTTGAFAVTQFACWFVSALYHRGQWTLEGEHRMRRLDVSMIFALCAGSFAALWPGAEPGRARWVALLGLCGALLWGWWECWRPPTFAQVPVAAMVCTCVATLPLVWTLPPGPRIGVLIQFALHGAGLYLYRTHRANTWPTTWGYHEHFHALTVVCAVLTWWIHAQLVRGG